MRLYASRGVTLLELIVVLAILGILAMAAVVAARPMAEGSDENTASTVIRLRGTAILKGRILTTVLQVNGETVRITMLPDGRVLTTAQGIVHPLTGRPNGGP